MKRFIRGTAILVLAVLLVAGLAFYVKQPSGGKAPPATDAHGHAPHAEGGVTLTDAKIAAVGIELDKAGPGVLHAFCRKGTFSG